MEMTEHFKDLRGDIKGLVSSLETNLDKFEKGNKAAGKRARASALTLTKACKELRKEISNIKNTK